MAKKKSGSGGVIAGAVIGVLALLAAVPRDVWIGIGVLAALGLAIYLHRQSKRSVEPPAVPDDPIRPVSFPEPVARTRTNPAAKHEPGSPLCFADDEVPVTVAPTQASSTNFRLPPAPKGVGGASWVPPGQSVTVSGVALPGGMVYVGTVLKTPSGDNDPCLIDPYKPIAAFGDFTERQMGYWPSYSDISATARRAYLNWLAGGRKDPEADVGYVFIFFYGLERRAVLDAAKDPAAQSDWPAIADELRRLLAVYGEKSNSF